ncbi:deoxyribose-phosphate aldolase (plasmid) [Rhizobium sp. CB3171]|uniref:deoxyribose-phosphate aldolase n=1 Tax=Rhizobium sp. CB3171 TaxID=3039157 RepID=UPI0024B21089|nr:deoxyribose-phosphate aldolase [Rhizobium sp. CB3171]WFU07083.1 deoxyribose-phosphate aldolase [Rhizobium sp. CB3171]
MIDHTNLRPEATEADIERYCQEAIEHKFRAVCVNPLHIPRVAARLSGSDVLTCSVVGFPLGAIPTVIKNAETDLVLSQGASEIDMVISVGDLKSGNVKVVETEIAALKRTCGNAVLKVILETCLLTHDEIIAACLASQAAGADFVKTSTGFAARGAVAEHVALMRQTVGPDMGVKASGGISTREIAEAMAAAGANRIGASKSVAIIAAR